jgi:uncharacterized protein (DUF885 family)
MILSVLFSYIFGLLLFFQTYIPNTRSSFGVGGLPQGAEYYKACLKWQLSIDLSADEIHRMGIREVQRVHSEIQKVSFMMPQNSLNFQK